MKRVGLILGAVAFVLVGVVAGMGYWAFTQWEAEKNRNRTAEARKKRWADPGADPDPDPGADPDPGPGELKTEN